MSKKKQKHLYLLEPRSKREFAFDTTGDGEKAMGEEKPDIGVPVHRVERQFILVGKKKSRDNVSVIVFLIRYCVYDIIKCENCLNRSCPRLYVRLILSLYFIA